MVGPYRIGGHLVLVSGPSLNVSEAGAQWQRMLPWLHYPAPPSGSCWDWEEGEMWGLGKAVGEEGSSQLRLPPGSGNGCCGKESEEQFSPLFVIYAGQLWAAKRASSSLNKRGLQNSMSPALGCGLTSLAAYFSYICFLAGKPLKIIFYLPSQFRSSSESPLPPAK